MRNVLGYIAGKGARFIAGLFGAGETIKDVVETAAEIAVKQALKNDN